MLIRNYLVSFSICLVGDYSNLQDMLTVDQLNLCEEKIIMKKNIKKYPVELEDYQCELILANAIVFGQLKTTLKRLAKKEGMHTINMDVNEISDLAGWMAAESNHASSRRKAEELGELCDYFEGLDFQIKRSQNYR